MPQSKEKLAKSIVVRLHQAGYEALFAGGCVRDRLRGVEPKDFDIATSATPEQVQQLFSKTIPVGAHFGVMLVVEEEIPFEVTTFRTDGGYQDGRHPTSVSFSGVDEDANRRDFTVNGLYFDVKTNQVIDKVGGEADVKRKLIRTIGDADKRFLEDHLRMMRAIRFAVQLGFEIEAPTFASIKKNAKLISKVSAERIRDELCKTLTSPNPALGLELLDKAGLLQIIIPEVEIMKGVEQPMEYHPEGDVFIHTMLLMKQLSSPPIELAMGALLHDIAKPQTFVRAVDRIRFHGHDKIGADMANDICRRMTFPNAQTEVIVSLVSEHLRFKDAFQMRLSTLKRFLSLDRFDLHLELHRIDCLASHGKLDAYHFCMEKWEEFKKLPPPPLRLINGDDLKALGFKPGPEFSKILRAVEDAILEGTVTSRDAALEMVKTQFVSKKGDA